MSSGVRDQNGPLAAAISTTVVGALARATGRGPTKARTTLGENGVFVVLEDTLTRASGPSTMPAMRRPCSICDVVGNGGMEKDLSREIEVLTGRTVVGFMSDNHIAPDLAVEVFVLAPRTEATGPRPS
jgi:uncharacterized protein YbcI